MPAALVQMAGRVIKYGAHMARVSSWIEHRMRAAITKNMVFPGGSFTLKHFWLNHLPRPARCRAGMAGVVTLAPPAHPAGGGDLLLLPLLSLDHPNAADPLPAMARTQHPVGAAQARKQPVQGQQEGDDEQLNGEQEGEQRQEQQQRVQAQRQEQQQRVQAQREEQAQRVQVQREAQTQRVQVQREEQVQRAQVQREEQAQRVQVQREELPPSSDQGSQPTAVGSPQPAAAGTDAAEPLAEAPAPGMSTQLQTVPFEAAVPSMPPSEDAVAAAPGGGSPALAVHWSDSQEELGQEPSLSQMPSPRHVAIAAAAARAAGRSPLASGSPAVAPFSGSGHLISQRHSSDAAESAASASPGFQGWADSRDGSCTAADAWDAAMTREGRGRSSTDAATPKLSSQPWRSSPAGSPADTSPPTSDPLGALRPPALAAVQQPPLPAAVQQPPAPAAVQQPKQLPGAQALGGAAGEAPRPVGLQLRLSATRSLDPDFVTSAEHTGFGEAPAAALPNYGVRRTVSAVHDPPRCGGSAHPHSPAAAKESVNAALNRSLAYLRQSSTASGAGSPPQQPSPPQQLQPQREPSAGSLPQRYANGGGAGDPQRVLQQGSFKEQAGKLFTRMNTAGKALATQVQQMQQQRATERAAAKQA